MDSYYDVGIITRSVRDDKDSIKYDVKMIDNKTGISVEVKGRDSETEAREECRDMLKDRLER